MGLFLAAGCDPSVDDPPSRGGSPPATTVQPVTATAACGPAALGPGDHNGLTAGLAGREFDVHVPMGHDRVTPAPVLFVLHPLTQDRDWGKRAANMIRKSDAEGFIAVFPEGTSGSWNGGTCCGTASRETVDDVTFIRQVHARVRELTCMDPRRVYATGLSNGAFMSHRLACAASDIFTAVAPVAGVLGLTANECHPTRPVPVLQIHGTDDILVPYRGGILGDSAEKTAESWAARNGCTGTPVQTRSAGDTTCRAYQQCAGGAEVSLCTVDGGGHCWFGEPFCFVGRNPRDLPATDLAWDFLKRFRM